MKLMVYEVLAKAAKATKKADKVKILKDNNSGALQDILRGTYDDRIVWLLPEGDAPPYTPNKPESIPSNLLKECVKFAYFVKGGKGPNMLQVRREVMFINLLESVHPEDAKLCIDLVNKKPIKGVSKAVVKEAFPHLLP